jgi:hypothetical protein
MKTTFHTELAVLRAAAGSSVDLARLQNEILRQALEETRCLMQDQKVQMEKLALMMQRRTTVLSPTQGFSSQTYSQRSRIFVTGHMLNPTDNL